MRPEEALGAARAADARHGGADDLPGLRIEPTERVSVEQLMEWAVIEPDVDLMRSTRRLGAPITWLKRMLLHVLRQYTRELESQQTRFNLHVALRLAELEDRLAPSSDEDRRAVGDPVVEGDDIGDPHADASP